MKNLILYKIVPYTLLMIAVSYLVFEIIAPKSMKESFYSFNDKMFFTLFIRPVKRVFGLIVNLKNKISLASSKRKQRKEVKREAKKKIKNSKKREKLDKKIDKLNKKVKIRHRFGLIVSYCLRKVFNKDSKISSKRNKQKPKKQSRQDRTRKQSRKQSKHQRIRQNEKHVINVSRQRDVVFNHAHQKQRNRKKRRVG